MRFKKEKQVIKLLLKASTASVSSLLNNCKMVFNFDGKLNHITLSSNAKIEIEAVYTPDLPNFNVGYIILDTPSENIFYDSINKGTSNYPILGLINSNTYIYNPNYKKTHITQDFLRNPLTLRLVSLNTNTVDFTNINDFAITLNITDEEEEQTQDINLRPEVKYNPDFPRNLPHKYL